MSIALMTMARKTALSTNEKFVLMALADWADDNGTNCWPSIYELSEYLTCSERTVQRLLRDLEQGGWIAVVGNHNGGGTSRRYALNVPKMDEAARVEHARREAEKERRRSERKNEAENPFFNGCQSVTPDKLSPVTTATQGVTTTTLRGDNHDKRGDTAVTPSTIDPPYIHQGSTIVGADAPKAKPAARATTLPSDFRPDSTAEQIARDFGLDILAEETAFSDYHSAKGTTFKDWQAGFRTWLRNANKFGQRATAARAGTVVNPHSPVETYAQRAARQRMEEIAPAAARKAPGAAGSFDAAQRFMAGGDVIDVDAKAAAPRIGTQGGQ